VVAVKELISVVIPAYNEERIIGANLPIILETLFCESYDLELIVVDDGSKDTTAAILEDLAALDARIKPVIFTRNFGKEAAVLAGLAEARGAAAIVMDADLQHPPQIAREMIALWRKGIPLVEAVKAERGDANVADGLFAKGFYWAFRKLSGMDLNGHSDYKLLDRQVIDVYLALPERNRFFRGLIHWTGYTSAQIPFSVAERSGGASQWNKLKLLRYAIDNITSFTSFPLKVISALGFATLIVGVLLAALSVLQKFQGEAQDGFTTVIFLIAMIGGVILLSIGVVGHYLARIYDEVKRRPEYLVRKSLSRSSVAQSEQEQS